MSDPTRNKSTNLTEAELKEIFNLVDLDDGGTKSRNELEALMKTIGLSATHVTPI